MKRLRYLIGLTLAVIALLCFAIPVLAAVGDISYLTTNPSNTSINLTWVKASGSTNTIVRYSTSSFPADYSSGTSGYSGTGSEVTISSLTSGTTYFFALWGFDGGSTYSTNPIQRAVTTLAEALPSGALTTTVALSIVPTAPANLNQAPDESSFNLEPFTSILKYFNEGEGGFGMPSANAWEFWWILGIVGGGIITYLKIKNFFVAYFVVFAITLLGVGLDLVQAWLIVLEITVGMGVWAIERYAQ
jgi:hypothetical protein